MAALSKSDITGAARTSVIERARLGNNYPVEGVAMSMQTVLWKSDDALSLDYCQVSVAKDLSVLEGTAVLVLDELPARITYRVECDQEWRTKAVAIQQDRAGETRQLNLVVSDTQLWHIEGEALPFATGFYDVDLEITPATNTLPLRRLQLGVGESRLVEAVWVRFPSLTVEALQQRYTRIDPRRYHYEGLSTGFETQLEVDDFGLVTNYHSGWQQLASHGTTSF